MGDILDEFQILVNEVKKSSTHRRLKINQMDGSRQHRGVLHPTNTYKETTERVKHFKYLGNSLVEYNRLLTNMKMPRKTIITITEKSSKMLWLVSPIIRMNKWGIWVVVLSPHVKNILGNANN